MFPYRLLFLLNTSIDFFFGNTKGALRTVALRTLVAHRHVLPNVTWYWAIPFVFVDKLKITFRGYRRIKIKLRRQWDDYKFVQSVKTWRNSWINFKIDNFTQLSSQFEVETYSPLLRSKYRESKCQGSKYRWSNCLGCIFHETLFFSLWNFFCFKVSLTVN